MGYRANLKAYGDLPRLSLTGADNVALDIPNGYEAFFLEGTSITIPSLNAGLRPGRVISLWGNTSTSSVALTDTGIASRADGKMILSASLTFTNGTVLLLKQMSDGAWQEISRVSNPG